MKKILLLLIALVSLQANVHIVTTYPYLGKLAQAIGGNNVHVKVLASPKFDPHFITPRPSLIPAIAKADMLIVNGAGLEIGWMPPLLRSANNPKVHIGTQGFVDASKAVRLINVPRSVSRANGDIHPEGNPHFNTDPHMLLPIASLIAKKLTLIDPAHHAEYTSNLARFTSHWKNYLKQFDARMKRCRGAKVVQYHQLYNYLLKRYGIRAIATIEPLPGIAPSSKHTLWLIQRMQKEHIKTILQDPYHEKKTAAFIASKTGAHVVILPHDVGAVPGTETLEDFYNTLAKRLCP